MNTSKEQVFLSGPPVTVTSARLVTPSRTYAIAGVTSVARGVIKPNRLGPLCTFVLAIAAVLFGLSKDNIQFALTRGLVWTGIGLVWWLLQKSEYLVKLNTAGGETVAYISKDLDTINQIIDALNEAIIARG